MDECEIFFKLLKQSIDHGTIGDVQESLLSTVKDFDSINIFRLGIENYYNHESFKNLIVYFVIWCRNNYQDHPIEVEEMISNFLSKGLQPDIISHVLPFIQWTILTKYEGRWAPLINFLYNDSINEITRSKVIIRLQKQINPCDFNENIPHFIALLENSVPFLKTDDERIQYAKYFSRFSNIVQDVDLKIRCENTIQCILNGLVEHLTHIDQFTLSYKTLRRLHRYLINYEDANIILDLAFSRIQSNDPHVNLLLIVYKLEETKIHEQSKEIVIECIDRFLQLSSYLDIKDEVVLLADHIIKNISNKDALKLMVSELNNVCGYSSEDLQRLLTIIIPICKRINVLDELGYTQDNLIELILYLINSNDETLVYLSLLLLSNTIRILDAECIFNQIESFLCVLNTHKDPKIFHCFIKIFGEIPSFDIIITFIDWIFDHIEQMDQNDLYNFVSLLYLLIIKNNDLSIEIIMKLEELFTLFHYSGCSNFSLNCIMFLIIIEKNLFCKQDIRILSELIEKISDTLRDDLSDLNNISLFCNMIQNLYKSGSSIEIIQCFKEIIVTICEMYSKDGGTLSFYSVLIMIYYMLFFNNTDYFEQVKICFFSLTKKEIGEGSIFLDDLYRIAPFADIATIRIVLTMYIAIDQYSQVPYHFKDPPILYIYQNSPSLLSDPRTTENVKKLILNELVPYHSKVQLFLYNIISHKETQDEISMMFTWLTQNAISAERVIFFIDLLLNVLEDGFDFEPYLNDTIIFLSNGLETTSVFVSDPQNIIYFCTLIVEKYPKYHECVFSLIYPIVETQPPTDGASLDNLASLVLEINKNGQVSEELIKFALDRYPPAYDTLEQKRMINNIRSSQFPESFNTRLKEIYSAIQENDNEGVEE